MSRNSIEKRSTLLEKSWINRSRCNPESATSIAIPFSNPIRNKKYQQSTSIRNFNADPHTLEGRYQALQKMYKGLLAKVSIQNQNVTEQQKEKAKLEKLHQINQKQINKLRGMLGFLQKVDRCTQTQMNQNTKHHAQQLKIRNNTQNQKINYGSNKDILYMQNKTNKKNTQSQLLIGNKKNNMGKSREENFNQSWASRSTKYLLSQPNNSQHRSSKQGRCLSPDNLKLRYKFIPSLPLA